ncbi:MAG: hypothetical protein ACP5GJ_03565 [Nanopusillaceae archaeon]|jgi:hypothetical protein
MDKKERKFKNITTTIPYDVYEDIKRRNLKLSYLILLGYDVITKMSNKSNNFNLENEIKEIKEKLDKILNILESNINK